MTLRYHDCAKKQKITIVNYNNLLSKSTVNLLLMRYIKVNCKKLKFDVITTLFYILRRHIIL
ncbi:hypothetical protein C161_21567 [Paenibacillus sp. FSL R5-192]|nr:hypothetical protein C161_21567 [Paenibacillus sp. FSL R5-192]